ncbi:16190_t:CDS:2 [Funneliformis geosporum]|nr:16190_t:CDS:2 [Funneliformis geosporum]
MIFVRKLQNLGLLIILLSVINTSSHPYPAQEDSYHVHRTDCNIATRSPTSYTSPDWSIGYKLSIHTDAGTFHEGPFLWWDGWVNGIYCNDIHLHLKNTGFQLRLSYNLDISYDKCFWDK